MSERSDRKDVKTPDVATALTRIANARGNHSAELDLSGLGLIELPESIGQLMWLERLDLSENQLTSLPEAFSQLTQLRSLFLTGNQLMSLPESISQLTQLRNLALSANQLTSPPEWLGQLTQLHLLVLSANQLTSLPEWLGQLTHLHSLYISGSQLMSLPECIGQLTQLRILALSRNKMTSLPEGLGQLTQLQDLSLYGNELTSLPEWLGQLRQLQILDLSGNQLTSLPEWIRDLESLEQLFLHDNPGLDIPHEVLGPYSYDVVLDEATPATPRDILDYYFRTRGGRRPLNEAKLILVGRGGVGKTSLVNRLIHGSFELGELKTEGIRITGWPLRLNGDEDVRLNVWDFGGQEIMHATHQFFLTQRSLYVLVLNGREGGEDADAEYWLKLIESFGGESPVVIVLNKINEHPFDLNRRALEQKYPAIRAIIKTDCADETGINELRQTIERETDRLEHLRDAFPSSWFAIKDRLAGMDKSYVSFDEYRGLCHADGESDHVAQEALAGYLHNLGIVLNYKDDPRLQDTHVLNPHWVTSGIYTVLNSRQLEAQQGEIRLHDLAVMLDPVEYPAHMRRFIFDLMKKFELCFSFPDDDMHYLIPELLDKQEPPETAEFRPAECLNFQYHYPILPEGLLPRFIVRTHSMSEGLPRWRTGVILQFEGNRALVKADVQDKRVFISVGGPPAGRRQLLGIIRSDFERIHRDIRNLQPQEMVALSDQPNVVVPYQELLVLEQHGMRSLPKVVGTEMIQLDVQALLNGVDLATTRRRESRIDEPRQSVRLFYSYAHKDERLRNELETHLKLLQRQGLIDAWHDRDIDAGQDWKQRINDNLERAEIILLLISADFIASEYCYEKELRRALERHEAGSAVVIPVIVRDVNWRSAPFAKLQALPKEGKAVTLWPNRDRAWRNVSEGIEKVAKQIRESGGRLKM